MIAWRTCAFFLIYILIFFLILPKFYVPDHLWLYWQLEFYVLSQLQWDLYLHCFLQDSQLSNSICQSSIRTRKMNQVNFRVPQPEIRSLWVKEFLQLEWNSQSTILNGIDKSRNSFHQVNSFWLKCCFVCQLELNKF